MATDTNTSSGSGTTFPPPGFNAEQAKKPLTKDQVQKSKEKDASSSLPDVSIPGDVPTSNPKTKATEAQSLAELAAEKISAETKEEKHAVAKKEQDKAKLTLWEKVKKEANHYWDGTKLLVAEVKISSKLALKMAGGYELTRREQRQVRQPLQLTPSLLTFT